MLLAHHFYDPIGALPITLLRAPKLLRMVAPVSTVVLVAIGVFVVLVALLLVFLRFF